jgi:hypothetical protein
MTKRLVLLAALVSFAVAFPLLAIASHVEIPDANDTRGLLDVQRVDLDGSSRPTWQVITFSDWTVARLWDKGYFLVRLDTFGSERYDYYALVRSDGYGMKGTLVRDRQGKPDFNISKLTAWHPTRSSVKVRVPLAKMRIGKGRFEYFWQVQTLFSNKTCVQICIDDAPDDRGVPEPIPGRSPDPLPTVTPTVTPTPTPSASP